MLTAFLIYVAVGILVMSVLIWIEPPFNKRSWLQLPLCVLLWWLSLGRFVYLSWRRKT